MDELLRNQVCERAGDRCEYCRLPQHFSTLPFQIDHIIALKHHGPTVLDNLALACYYCNSHKGPNIAGFDADLRAVTRLFHPRMDGWKDHFRWDGVGLLGTSAVGRVTVDVLNINLPGRLEHRRLLSQIGLLFLDA
jgi:HNH endonuclease